MTHGRFRNFSTCASIQNEPDRTTETRPLFKVWDLKNGNGKTFDLAAEFL
jgi:hypothetical protein